MSDFRALCAELLQPLAEYDADNPYHEHRAFLITRARAALSEPAVGPDAPSDEEWEALKERLWDQHQTAGYQGERFVYDIDFNAALDDARAVLARYGTTPTPIPVAERLPGEGA